MTIVFDCFSLSVLSRSSQFVFSGSSELVMKTRVFDCSIGLSYSRHILSIFCHCFIVLGPFCLTLGSPRPVGVSLSFLCTFVLAVSLRVRYFFVASFTG